MTADWNEVNKIRTKTSFVTKLRPSDERWGLNPGQVSLNQQAAETVLTQRYRSAMLEACLSRAHISLARKDITQGYQRLMRSVSNDSKWHGLGILTGG